jgi:hypothetical protein
MREQPHHPRLLKTRRDRPAPSWTVIETYRDAGMSDAKGRAKRPGLDAAMLKDAGRRKFDVVKA